MPPGVRNDGLELLDRISNLARLDLISTDSRFKFIASDGNTRPSGMLGAFKLRVALAPDNPTFSHSLEAILTRNEQDPQPSGSFERYPKGTAPCP